MDTLPPLINAAFSSLNIIGCEELCEIINGEDLSEKQIYSFLVSLVNCWLNSLQVVAHKTRLISTNVDISLELVLEIVEKLQYEEMFTQVLFLLPEQLKRIMLSNICCFIQLSSGSRHKSVTLAIVKFGFTEYTQRIMHVISDLSKTDVTAFYGNIKSLVELVKLLPDEDILVYVVQLLQNFLITVKQQVDYKMPSIQLDPIDSDFTFELSALKKSQVDNLMKICKTLLETKSFTLQEITPMKKYFNVCDEEYVSVVADIVSCLSDQCSNHENLVSAKPKFTESLMDSLVQIQVLLDKVREEPSIQSSYLVDTVITLFQITSKHFSSDAFLSYAIQPASVNELLDLTQAYCKSDEEKMLERFQHKDTSALDNLSSRVNNAYLDSRDYVMDIVDFDEVKESANRINVASVSTYLINYGTPDMLLKLTESCKHLDRNKSKTILEMLKQVLIEVLPYLTTKTISNMLSRRSAGMEWYVLQDSSQFSLQLNEAINKVTDQDQTSETSDVTSAMKTVAQLIFQSPKICVVEILQRIFTGQLKSSIFANLLSNLPSLMVVSYRSGDNNDDDEDNDSLFSLVKKIYVKTKNGMSSFAYLKDVLRSILNANPTYFDHFINVFVTPNLCLETSDTLLKVPQTLDLLQIGLLTVPTKHVHLHTSWLTVQSLFTIKDSYKRLMRLINECINSLINCIKEQLLIIGRQRFEEYLKDMKTYLKSLNWLDCLYFYDIFCCFDSTYRFNIPVTLLELLAANNDDTFIPLEEERNVNGCYKWTCFFSLGLASSAVMKTFSQNLSPVDADIEIPNIIQAVADVMINVSKVKITLSTDYVGTYSGEVILSGLFDLIEKGKFLVSTCDVPQEKGTSQDDDVKNQEKGTSQDVDVKNQGIKSYIMEELHEAPQHHPLILSILIMVQAFVCMYDEVMDDEESTLLLLNNVDVYIPCLNNLVILTKQIENVKERLHVLYYFIEQLGYASTVLETVVTNRLSLLALELATATCDGLPSLEEGTDKSNYLLKLEAVCDLSESSICQLFVEKFRIAGYNGN